MLSPKLPLRPASRSNDEDFVQQSMRGRFQQLDTIDGTRTCHTSIKSLGTLLGFSDVKWTRLSSEMLISGDDGGKWSDRWTVLHARILWRLLLYPQTYTYPDKHTTSCPIAAGRSLRGCHNWYPAQV